MLRGSVRSRPENLRNYVVFAILKKSMYPAQFHNRTTKAHRYLWSYYQSETLKTYVGTGLTNGFIRPSTSQVKNPILFLSRKNGSLGLCVNFCAPNNLTIKGLILIILRPLLSAYNWQTLRLPELYHAIFYPIRSDRLALSKKHLWKITIWSQLSEPIMVFSSIKLCVFRATSIKLLPRSLIYFQQTLKLHRGSWSAS